MSGGRVSAGFLVVQLIAAVAMTGAIWVVQLVVYPQFVEVGEAEFVSYHARYMQRITWIVMPLMLVELGAAVGSLVACRRQRVWRWLLVASVLLAVVWASTALMQVPRHERLAAGLDARTVRELVQGNWLRTVGWSLRAVLLAIVVFDWRFLSDDRARGS